MSLSDRNGALVSGIITVCGVMVGDGITVGTGPRGSMVVYSRTRFYFLFLRPLVNGAALELLNRCRRLASLFQRFLAASDLLLYTHRPSFVFTKSLMVKPDWVL